jgi:RNA polymerase sigma-70 factor (ECF subfamily)
MAQSQGYRVEPSAGSGEVTHSHGESISLNGGASAGHHGSVTALPMPLMLPGDATSVDPEDDVVVRLRDGQRAAIEEAYVAHHAAVRGFARRLVGDDASAEDIVHETFVALPRAIRKFRGEGSLRSFLIGVAINHSRRHVRSAMRRRRATERLAERDELLPKTIDATEELIKKQLATKLWAALDRLPIDQRVVFVLCEVEQRTSVEVSGIVAAPEGTVRTRLFHAKRKLRELLEGEV